MLSHKPPPLGFTGWFATGLILFSLLDHVVGRAQAMKQSRKKCGKTEKTVFWSWRIMCLRQGFPGTWSTGKTLAFSSLLEMRGEEPKFCSAGWPLLFKFQRHMQLCAQSTCRSRCGSAFPLLPSTLAFQGGTGACQV